MPALISVSEHEALFKATGGVLVTHGSETTYGHLEKISAEVLGGADPGVITGEPSLLIAEGALSGVTHKEGAGETITTDELDAAGAAVGSPTTWVLREPVPDDRDGGLIRWLLRAG